MPDREFAVKAMYENGMDCLTQSWGFERLVSCRCLKHNERKRQTSESMGFKKVRLTCISQASAATIVCVGVTVTATFAISQIVLPSTTGDVDEFPKNE